MKQRKNLILMVTLLGMLWLFTGLSAKTKQWEQKSLQAHQLNETVHIDGVLNEAAWQNGGAGDFIQSDPIDGAPATEKTTVWVGFDDNALYIAARMSDSQPDKIIGRLGRRDDWVDSDWFVFSVDPYYDRRSGYQFAINPSGSIVDMTLYNDERQDDTWDGVWESAAKIHDNGWTIEMRLPYHQLRFKKNGIQQYTWGVNFQRIIKRKNETDVFAWVPKEESGYVSRFAELVGIHSIAPKKHIELLPFTTGKAAFITKESNSFLKSASDFYANGGLDLKMGLKSNLILDLSINPDFGQVEVDPAVINLTAGEIYFEEKRPFYIEGADIYRFGTGGASYHSGFGWANPLFFYSRRIGQSSQDVSSPGSTLAAAKVTGKIGNGWNLGFLSVLTKREYTGQSIEDQPFSYYGVLRGQKEFNQGKQGLGFMTTAVIRDLRTLHLQEQWSRNAFSLGIDGWTFLNRKQSWVVSGWLGGTGVAGSSKFISTLQRSYFHYYQRPDAAYLSPDPDATSMKGWGGRMYITRQGGNFIFNASLGAVSPGFDVNDMGFQYVGDKINGHIQAGYASLRPGEIFRQWHFIFAAARGYDFGGNKIDDLLYSQAGGQWLNYWDASITLLHQRDRWSNLLTRGGPLMIDPAFTRASLNINSDNRNPLVFTLSANYLKGKSVHESWSAAVGLRWKPAGNISLSIEPGFDFNHPSAQWVTAVDDTLMTRTYGTRYIFANMKQKTLLCSLRINWIFSPKLSLQAYIQPFISVGHYYGFKELAQSGSFDFNSYGEGGSIIFYESGKYIADPDGTGPAASFSFSNPDFNYKSLRGTIVLRWEYRPGSTLYAVWTQRREDFTYPGDFHFSRDLGALFRAPGDNIFMVKFTYRLNLN